MLGRARDEERTDSQVINGAQDKRKQVGSQSQKAMKQGQATGQAYTKKARTGSHSNTIQPTLVTIVLVRD